MVNFYAVLGHRDYLVIKEKIPVWEFIKYPYILSSLVYINDQFQLPSCKSRFIDCGAWSYKSEKSPKFTPDEAFQRYTELKLKKGDLAAAVDHMILPGNQSPHEMQRRLNITLKNAKKHFELSQSASFTPIGVVQGQNIGKRVELANKLLSIGYDYLALGGLAGIAGQKSFVQNVIRAVLKLRNEFDFKLHVLGISSFAYLEFYKQIGVNSFDGSAMFLKAADLLG